MNQSFPHFAEALAMAARVTEVLDEKLVIACKVASGLLRSGHE